MKTIFNIKFSVISYINSRSTLKYYPEETNEQRLCRHDIMMEINEVSVESS